MLNVYLHFTDSLPFNAQCVFTLYWQSTIQCSMCIYSLLTVYHSMLNVYLHFTDAYKIKDNNSIPVKFL